MQKIKFGTDGFRGIIGEEFTFETIEILAYATALFAKERWKASLKGMAIGYDMRFLSPEAAQKVAKIFKNTGIKVFLSEDFVPTPVLSYNIKRLKTAGGIMITASHNPYMFNGFKIKTPEGGSAPEEVTSEIEKKIQNISSIPYKNKNTKIIKKDFITPYLEWIKKSVDLKGLKKKVISDPIHGAVRSLFSDILSFFDVDVKVISYERDPNFGGRDPEPIEKNIFPLIKEIKNSLGKAVGIANDGDGDRVCMVDETGEFVSSHQIFALVLDHLYRNKKMRGDVIKTFSTSSLINKMCKDFGLNLYETPIGFKHIMPFMIQKDILIAGEESGGIGVKGHIPERDGIYSALLVLEKMSLEKKSLRELLEDLNKKYGPHYYKRKDIPIDIEKAKIAVEKISSSHFSKIAGKKITYCQMLDGVKLILEDGGWLLIRASGTEPLLRLYCEASSMEEVEELLNEGEKLIS